MKIEEGKYYRRADGEKAGPAVFRGGDETHPWMVNARWNTHHLYTGNGISHMNAPWARLVAEWTDRPPLNTYIEREVTDRLHGDCPVPPKSDVTCWVVGGHVSQSLAEKYDWHNVYAYLVHSYPPEEKRAECARGVTWEELEHGTCIIRDGEVDWSTWEPKP